jgi:hypothetical protein
MKYIKTYEKKKAIEGYKNKIFINVPSTIYFKSPIKYQVIIVDDVYQSGEIYSSKLYDSYKVISHYTLEFKHDDTFFCTSWDQIYSKNDFDRISFMTAEDFYKEKPELVMAILNYAIRESKGNRTQYHLDRMNHIIDVLTIPQTEHIIQAHKYNL